VLHSPPPLSNIVADDASKLCVQRDFLHLFAPKRGDPPGDDSKLDIDSKHEDSPGDNSKRGDPPSDNSKLCDASKHRDPPYNASKRGDPPDDAHGAPTTIYSATTGISSVWGSRQKCSMCGSPPLMNPKMGFGLKHPLEGCFYHF
jgi:hypothetical protein